MPKYDDESNRERKKVSHKKNNDFNGKFSQKHIRLQTSVCKRNTNIATMKQHSVK